MGAGGNVSDERRRLPRSSPCSISRARTTLRGLMPSAPRGLELIATAVAIRGRKEQPLHPLVQVRRAELEQAAQRLLELSASSVSRIAIVRWRQSGVASAGLELQVDRLELWPLAHQQRVVQCVLQFPDVSGPGVLEQAVRGARAQADAVPPELLRVPIQEVLGERRDVTRALTKRRHHERADLQSIVEVFAKPPGADRGAQIHVGGSDQANVDRDRGARADARDFAFLKHTQQLDLRGEREVPNLIQEQRAAVGCFEPAALRQVRAGEGAFLVTEQLALQQIFGEGARVDGQEGTPAAGR